MAVDDGKYRQTRVSEDLCKVQRSLVRVYPGDLGQCVVAHGKGVELFLVKRDNVVEKYRPDWPIIRVEHYGSGRVQIHTLFQSHLQRTVFFHYNVGQLAPDLDGS